MSKTAVYNVRLDIRALATLHRYYSEGGTEFGTISSLNRRAIESLADLLIEQTGAKPFELLEAVNYFEERDMMKTLHNRGGGSIARHLQRESLNLEGFNTSYIDRKSKDVYSKDQYEKAREILNQRRDDQTSSAILGAKPGELKTKKETSK